MHLILASTLSQEVDVCFDTIGFAKSKVYLLEKLPPGSVVDGPAIIMDKLSTILVEPECSATITEAGDIGTKIFYSFDYLQHH